MNLKELVGKTAIRTGPVVYGNGHQDYSYGTDPLIILAVTDTHIVYEHAKGCFKSQRSILDSRWLDDKWGDYDELMKAADKTKKECHLELVLKGENKNENN